MNLKGATTRVLTGASLMLFLACAACSSVDNDDGIVSNVDGDVLKPQSLGERTVSESTSSGMEVRVKNDAEKARMRKFLDARNDARLIAETIRVSDDEIIDCVYATLQHGLGGEIKGFASPPSDASGGDSLGQSLAQGEVAPTQRYGSETRLCPSGTIPRLHVDLNTLVRFESLEDYFRKVPRYLDSRDGVGEPQELQAPAVGPVPLAAGPTDEHQYATYRQYVTNIGAEAALNLWSPYTELNSEFSLSQMWVANGSGANTETVEAGWQVFVNKYGNSSARLFIYFTPDDYGAGGCYNLDCSKFVQVDNSVVIGGSFSSYSTSGGAQYAPYFRLQMNSAGDWWLKYGTAWVGYWPRSLFDSNGIYNSASRVTFGGEIIDHRNLSLHTSTDMGSGAFSSSGFQYSAYQRSMAYYYGSMSAPSIADSNASVSIVTGSLCYDASTAFDSGSVWRRYMYFGGPGYSGNCQ